MAAIKKKNFIKYISEASKEWYKSIKNIIKDTRTIIRDFIS